MFRRMALGLFGRTGLVLAAFFILVSGAQAQDCGIPPQVAPVIPDGETISRDELVAAIAEVKQYSADVNAYLDCMDEREKLLFIHLTEQQRARWTEDIQAVLDDLAAIEVGMNKEIEKYNARIKKDDNESP